MTVPTASWSESTPAGSRAASLGDNDIREMKTQIREVIDVDHKFESSGQHADNGCHDQVTLLEKADIGTGAVGKTKLGSQTVSGRGELVYTNEDDTDIVLTKGTYLNTLALDTTLTGMANILNVIYPIGCIYTTIVSTNPGTVFGFGTWTAFGAGRVLVGLDAGQTEFDTVEETGGAKTHTLTESEMPAHTHTSIVPASGFGGTDGNGSTTSGSTGSTGGGAAHNNLQPYIVVYFFKRTA